MPRRGENIYKRKDGRWEGRFIIDRDVSGKAKYKSIYGKSYSDIKRKLEIAKQNSISLQSFYEYHFSLFCIEWLKEHRKNIKESTYIKYYNIIYMYIIPDLGEIQFNKISIQMMNQFIQKLLNQGSQNGQGLSTKSVADVISVFKNIMRYIECHYGHIHFDYHQMTVKQNKEKRMRILNSQEQQKLCQYILEHQTLIHLGILLALSTGIRIGELCALRWDHIYLDEEELIIDRTMQRIQNKDNNNNKKTKIIITTPKSQCSIRRIPIPQDLIQLLKPFECHQNEFFLTGHIEKYIEPRCLENKFKVLMQQNNIENMHFHALRHTFATKCIELGFDVKCLSEILGHANVNITLNKYVHPSFALKRDYMNKINQLINV